MKKFITRATLLSFSLAPVLAFAQHTPIQGVVKVLDGDTLAMDDVRIRLYGIDAPETAQSCYLNGQAWQCGKASGWELEKLIAGRAVICAPQSRDQYGRLLSKCSVAGVDINAWMVANGWAIAYARYSKEYVH